MDNDPQRLLRRPWNRRKSHLPKYTSLPELQLRDDDRPLFQCRQCGFANVLLPLCLWCTWSSQEAQHEFRLSMPRAKRVSAPCRVLFVLDAASPPPSRREEASKKTKPYDLHGKQTPSSPSSSTSVLWNTSESQKRRCLAIDSKTTANGRGGILPVASMPHISRCALDDDGEDDGKTAQDEPHASFGFSNLPAHVSKATHTPQTREEDQHPPTSENMNATTPHKPAKASRRALFIDFSDEKNTKKCAMPLDAAGPSSSTTRFESESHSHRPARTLRRKNHLNIIQPSKNKTDAEPIPISLILPSLPSSSAAPLKTMSNAPNSPRSPHSSTTASSFAHTRGDSMSSSHTTSTRTTSPESPLVPTHPPSSPSPPGLKASSPYFPSNPSAELAAAAVPMPYPPSEARPSSPVKLGHPNRPYYSAIRKHGISPPSSRPSSPFGPTIPSSSLTGAGVASSSRPQSYNASIQPSSSATPSNTVASRHLSMSAVLHPASNPFSAFALIDDDDDEDGDEAEREGGEGDNEDNEISQGRRSTSSNPNHHPHIGIPPNLARFSLPASHSKRSPLQHVPPLPSSGDVSTKHRRGQSHTISNASSSYVRVRGSIPVIPGMGFSMSGETELRLALASAAGSSHGPTTLQPQSATAYRAAADSSKDSSEMDEMGMGSATPRFGDRFPGLFSLPLSSSRGASSAGRQQVRYVPRPQVLNESVDDLGVHYGRNQGKKGKGYGSSSAAGGGAMTQGSNSFMGKVKRLRQGLKDILSPSSPTA